jgi:hypothetical protein
VHCCLQFSNAGDQLAALYAPFLGLDCQTVNLGAQHFLAAGAMVNLAHCLAIPIIHQTVEATPLHFGDAGT